jgi:hypothetical protein
MRAIAALMIVAGLASTASADRFGGGAWLHYELQELHALDDAPMRKSSDMILAGARVGGYFGKRVAYAASFDFALGSTINASGFLYELSLLPLGMALRPSERSLISLASGVAVNGAVGTLDDVVALPVELTAEMTLGPFRLMARGRVSFVAGADGRQNGAPNVSWADELDATVGIRLGPKYRKWEMASGNGYFLGASYRELGGATFAGLVLGYSIDAGTKMSGIEW